MILSLNSVKLTLVALLLVACAADPEQQARKAAVQDRELPLAIDQCIRHAMGESGALEALTADGYRPASLTPGAVYEKSVPDLDQGVLGPGYVRVGLLDTECRILTPVSIAVVDELKARVTARLTSLGFKRTESVNVLSQRTTTFTNGSATLSMSGFFRGSSNLILSRV
jgi:hypothetical protein